MRKISFYFISLATLFGAPILANAATPQIRVALVREASQLRLTGRNFYCYLPGTPESEHTRLPRQGALIHHTGAGFMLDDQFLQSTQLDCISGEGILKINDIPTQGHITITTDGIQKVAAVVELPMEQYLIGVIQGEVGENWPSEALKAQAIAARSYALALIQERRNQAYDVATTTKDQVYTSRIKIPTPIQAAVLNTQGQVLKFKGKTLKSFYHSCCGGAGEDFQNVWKDLSPGKSAPPFPAPVAKDPFCKKSPQRRWELQTTDGTVITALQSKAPKLTSFDQIEFKKEDNGRIASVTLPGNGKPVVISGNQFRKALGYETMKSTWFTAKQHGHAITFSGRGYGHGVGLCQWGAKGMAEKKKTAAEILAFYYPGAEIVGAYK